MARVTESRGNDLVLRQTRTWIMGDGTTNAALKGSRKGRRQSQLSPPETPARPEEEGSAAAVWHPACPDAPVPTSTVLS